MRYTSLSALALLGLSSVFAEEAAAPSDVLNLVAETFESTVNPAPLILVEFFAPWCGHCKALAPHYEEAATTLKEKGIPIAKVDCVDQAELCQANGVQGYPTLFVFRNGTPTPYGGPRKADGIVSYMVKQSLPSVTTVTTTNFDEFSKGDKVVAIAYVSSTDDAPVPAFSAAAEKQRDNYLFGVSTDEELIKAQGITPPQIVVYRSFDEPKTEYSGSLKDVAEADIEGWLKDLSVPVLDQVDGENYGTYASSTKPLAYLFIDPTKEDKDAHLAALRPVAEEFKSKLNFVWIDALRFGDHAKALNVKEAKWPAFVIQNIQNQLKFPLSQEADPTTASIKDWVNKFVKGELKPELKSEPVPETQDEPVYTLVGKTFDEVVFDDAKDVFVEFYATWCGHCKKLKPIWDELGEKYAEVKDKIVIAKLEATENDLPPSAGFQIQSFPTIKFKKAGTKEFIDYDGDRTLESFVAFVEENAVNDVKVPEKKEEPVVAAKEEAAKEQVVLEKKEEEKKEAEKHDEL